MKKYLLLCLCFAFTFVLKAQTQDKKWNIGLHGGMTQYKGDLGSDFYRADMAFYGFGGLSVSRYIGGHLDLSFMATKGSIGYKRANGTFKANVTTATINARFQLIGPGSPVRPYLFIGGGAMMFARNVNVSKNTVDYAAPSFGAGINFKLGPSVMLNVQEMFMYSSSDKRDGVNAGENDGFLYHTVGLTFNFGEKKDADNDGVVDRNDKCPNTPTGVAVDEDNGCPLDRDNDGVADYLDNCPDLAGMADLQGCPDKDKDGIADKDDACPDVAGLTKFKGCPDTDGDGITDKEDRCPDAVGTLALKGCPDADKDGVADLDDKCPNTKNDYVVDVNGCPLDNDKDGIINEEDHCPDKFGTVALNGCPDTDGDGVADDIDHCPTVKGTFANKGCPEFTKADIVKITNIASKIFFEFDSDKLIVASLVQLDDLAAILKKYPASLLQIEGHTDNVGEDAYNLTLSQKRTESVKLYLISKGIEAYRLTATGYGETKPIADNKTDMGRAKNRRVELKTSY